MKRWYVILLMVIFNFIFEAYAYAGAWVNIDINKAKIWIDTSHWESYVDWVDTSHWETKTYSAWVVSGYWNGSEITGWVSVKQHDEVYITDWIGNAHDYRVACVNAAKSDVRAANWVTEQQNHGMGIEGFSTKTTINYGPYDNGDGSFRELTREWKTYTKEKGYVLWSDYALYSDSDGYNVRTIRNSSWVDTSHWETRTGSVWVNSGYNETRYKWVTSGYWDEAHGSVSIAKSPRYVFTRLTEQNDGDVMHMDLDLSWSMNKKVTKVTAYHDVKRYKNKGTERIYGTNLKNNGLNTLKGSGNYRFEYNHPGDPDSLLYVEFNFDNGTKVRVFAKIPINGIATTEKLSAPNPVFDKSIMDADSISF